MRQCSVQAMKLTRNTYDDMPGAITEGRPHSQTSRNPNEHSDSIKKNSLSPGWNKKLQIMKDHDWLIK